MYATRGTNPSAAPRRAACRSSGRRAGRPVFRAREETRSAALPEERHFRDRGVGLGPRVNRAMETSVRRDSTQKPADRRVSPAAPFPTAPSKCPSSRRSTRQRQRRSGSAARYGLCSRFSMRTRSIASFSRSWLKTAKDDQTVLSVNAAIRPRPTLHRPPRTVRPCSISGCGPRRPKKLEPA